jgi:hypothetical protein
MARYNEILVGRFARFAQKVFGTKGGVPTAQLAGDVQISIPLFSGVEHRYLESWERFGVNVNVVASVGNNSAFRFRNPLASNLVVVIEKLLYNNAGAADQPSLFLGPQTTNFTNPITPSIARLDSRERPQPGVILSTQNAGASTSNKILFSQLAAGTNFDAILFEDQELTILPGDALDITTGIVNQPLNVSLWWRERFLEDPERF